LAQLSSDHSGRIHHSGDRVSGLESYGNTGHVLSVQRSAASSPSNIFSKCGLSVDFSPESSAGPSTPVPSCSLPNLPAARIGSPQSSSGAKGRARVKWIFPSEVSEQPSGDLLKIYSERMYGSSFS
jgi:hypothetical protein